MNPKNTTASHATSSALNWGAGLKWAERLSCTETASPPSLIILPWCCRLSSAESSEKLVFLSIDLSPTWDVPLLIQGKRNLHQMARDLFLEPGKGRWQRTVHEIYRRVEYKAAERMFLASVKSITGWIQANDQSAESWRGATRNAKYLKCKYAVVKILAWAVSRNGMGFSTCKNYGSLHSLLHTGLNQYACSLDHTCSAIMPVSLIMTQVRLNSLFL